MSASLSTAPTSVLGLALTFDPTAPELPETLATLRARPGLVLEEPQMPFAALALETTDPRGDHAWLESLAGVLAVDVVFVEVLAEEALAGHRRGPRRRRSRDPLDDAPLPDSGPATEADPDFPSA
ncbi:MAG: hypothetical protein IAE82_13390 [Opitutaceae bacterium]|nr:hypothetical protein [Opitutaceae bacterium]